MTIQKILDFAQFVIKETRGKAIWALLFLLLSSLTESISILLLIPVLQLMASDRNFGTFFGINISSYISSEWIPNLLTLLIIFTFLIILQSLFGRFRTLYMTDMMQTAVDRLRTDLFIKIGSARWSAIVKHRESDLTLALTTEIDRIQGAVYSLLSSIQNVVVLVFYVMISAIISLKMTVFATFVGTAIFLLLNPVRRRSGRHGHQLSKSMSHRQRALSQFLSGMKVAKAFNIEPDYFKKFENSLQEIHKGVLEFTNLNSIGTFSFQVASAFSGAAFIYYAYEVVHLSLPKIAVMLFLFMRITPRFNLIQDAIQRLLGALPTYEIIDSLIKSFRHDAENNDSLKILDVPIIKNDICLNDVVYSYDSGAVVLKNINIIIPIGQVTAIIGPSGGGKSTIADLILGLLEPVSGSVTIDGVTLNSATRRSWREQTAYVSQDIFLLNDTIAGNLLVGKSQASPEELWEALSLANAAEFVRRLPNGLETIVGDRGALLSGGERQRLALARALIRKPNLLLLDEATSALDWENQRLIAKAVEQLKGNMTVVTIAHRASMIAGADWVVSVENGVVVEHGRYPELMANPRSRLSLLMAGERFGRTK